MLGPAQTDDTGSTSGTSSSSGNSSTSEATITANDFLQLLVTEMQNQDPTANTDPNEYINQLVQVNSLQQLIQINQNTTSTSSAGSGSGDSLTQGASPGVTAPGSSGAAGSADGGAIAAAPGNLSVPKESNASARVANALGAATQQLAPGSSSTFDSMLSSLKARARQAGPAPSTPAH
jgi:flagellar basal-body rod modification protein FlgD